MVCLSMLEEDNWKRLEELRELIFLDILHGVSLNAGGGQLEALGRVTGTHIGISKKILTHSFNINGLYLLTGCIFFL